MIDTVSREKYTSFQTPLNDTDSNSNRPLNKFKSDLSTRGEIEAAITGMIVRFEREYLGRGPTQVRTHLIGELLLVRLSGVLTPAEIQLVNSSDAVQGRSLVKQVRRHLIETVRPVVEEIVAAATGVKVVSTLFDIGIATDEEFILFTLAETPKVRESARK